MEHTNGFLYRAGDYLTSPVRGRWSESLTPRERTIDLGSEGTISLPKEAAEAFTISWIEMVTAHEITMDTLDTIGYLIDEARMNHPDQVWNNGPIGPELPVAVAEYLAQKEQS